MASLFETLFGIQYHAKQAYLSLKQKPGFVFSVVSTMGLALGAFICIFTLAYQVLIKTLPYPSPDSLYRVEQIQLRASGEIDNRSFSYPGLNVFYKKQQIFTQVAMIEYHEAVVTSLASQPLMDLAYITPEWFSLLGIKMAKGVPFKQHNGINNSLPQAILSYETWKVEFNLEEDILNQKLTLAGVSYSIIGVVDEHFIEPEIHQTGRKNKIWLPWDLSPNQRLNSQWDAIGRFFAIGRLKPELTANQAAQQETIVANKLWQDNVAQYQVFNGWQMKVELHSFSDFILCNSRATITQLLAAMLALLVLASANVGNLFISRTAEQFRVLSLRAALGANKKKLFSGLLAEALLLLLLATIVGWIVASFGLDLLQQQFSAMFPRLQNLSLDKISLLMSFIFVISFSYLFAKLSSNIIRYRQLNLAIQTSAKGSGLQVSKTIRHWLIASQIAIASTLIFFNLNLLQAANTTINEPMGFSVKNLHALFVGYSKEQWPSVEERDSILTQVEKSLSQFPEVEAVTRTTAPYYGFGQWIIKDVYSNKTHTVNGKAVNEQYFQMIKQPLLEGDYFSQQDINDQNQVAIVNQAYAKLISPNQSAIGMTFEIGPGFMFKIVGIVKNTNIPGRAELAHSVFTPARKGGNSFTLKIKEGQKLTRTQVVSLLKKNAPNYIVQQFDSVETMKKQWLSRQIMTVYASTSLSFISLFLAAVGLYGILGYQSKMRRFEFGIRLAFGAKRKTIVMQILFDHLSPLLMGLLASGMFVLATYLSDTDSFSQYLNIQMVYSLFVALALVLVVMLLACYLPVRQVINLPVAYSLRATD